MKQNPTFTRRTILGSGITASGMIIMLPLSGCGGSSAPGPSPRPSPSAPPKGSLIADVGPLLAPDANGVMLAQGFTSRIIAYSGETSTTSSNYVWHAAPDGGAVFPDQNNGWIYVSNSELSSGNGGVGVLRFNADGDVVDSYSILTGTDRNCAGGATPWQTWLSCEEVSRGQVWECDPFGVNTAVVWPLLGSFAHEAIAVDPTTNIIYMTEDKVDGGFYRFVPENPNVNGIPDLSAGKLQVASVDQTDNSVIWLEIPDPLATTTSVRYQVSETTPFKGGEGIVYYDKMVSFVTKHDNRIWVYQTDTGIVSVLYDRDTAQDPILSGLDNMTLSQDGELIVSEDGGDLQIVAVAKNGQLVPLLQLVGHDSSEVAGPAFSPDGKRLYFSSQRGTEGRSSAGITFEVTGPFHA